jgi:chromosome partitioning protein
LTARIVALAQQKGGAGKTTLLIQLATVWRRAGLTCALIDLDPQRSLARWGAARAAGGRDDLPVRESAGWRAGAEISRAAAAADIVLADCPGSADALLRGGLRAAHLALVPAQPSAPDLWATGATLDMTREEGTDALVVLNRVPPRGASATAEARRGLRGQGAAVAETEVAARVAFAHAFARGLGVVEAPRPGRAGAEAEALAAEVAARLGLRR